MKNSSFVSSIHSCRAIAILFIVAGHSLWTFNWIQNPETRDFLADFLENGTVLFVFVSGFLFQHLSRKFRYQDYLKKKYLYVIVPYVIVSTPAVIYALSDGTLPDLYPTLQGTSILFQALWLYIKGGAHINYPLWFIPMISLYFLAAPLFIIITRHPQAYWGLLLLIPLSLLLHRAQQPNLDTLHLALYYLSAYIFGMCCSQYRPTLEPLLRRDYPWWLGVFLGCTLIHFIYAGHHGNYTAEGYFTFDDGYIDWLFLQKLILCLGLWGTTLKYEIVFEKPLKYLGDVSFAVFFVHRYFIFAFEVLRRWRPITGNIVNWSLTFVAVLSLSVGLAYAVQKIGGKYSRYIIGS